MTVSIIIAVKTWQKNLEECVGKCGRLDFKDFEILILPDEPMTGNFQDSRIKLIPTGSLSPAQKRDKALEYAQGEILAFIDDDAYPASGWLKLAMENFKDGQVAAVGGPAITPPEDDLRQEASGAVYASFLVSGRYTYRYRPGAKREVDDYPSCNFLVRKSIMQELGGFKTNFWPGEDTKLCLDITKGLGKKIIYDPRVLVYHHRRPLYLKHLKQIASYAIHRGYFVKKYPKTSLKLSYFSPSLFLFAIFDGIILALSGNAILKAAYLMGLSFYIILVLIFGIFNGLKTNAVNRGGLKRAKMILLISSGIMFTHLTYGFYFLKGLISGRLKEQR